MAAATRLGSGQGTVSWRGNGMERAGTDTTEAEEQRRLSIGMDKLVGRVGEMADITYEIAAQYVETNRLLAELLECTDDMRIVLVPRAA